MAVKGPRGAAEKQTDAESLINFNSKQSFDRIVYNIGRRKTATVRSLLTLYWSKKASNLLTHIKGVSD